MGKPFFFLIATLFLTACSPLLVEEESSSANSDSLSFSIVTPTESREIELTSATGSCSYIIDASTSSVTISGEIAGKTIYYALVNTLSQDISREYVRYVSDSADSTDSARALTQNLAYISHSHDEDGDTCFHGYDFHPAFEKGSSRNAVDSAVETNQLSYKVGETKKKLYAVKRNESYQLKNATLWAFNDICNVWVVDDDAFLKTEASRIQTAEKFASKFKAMYPLIRNVFGNESDEIYTSTRGAKTSLNNASETGTKVNIVIYDLFEDKATGSTVGFFSGMDYYKNGLSFSNVTIDHSNEGKYFYIDSYFAARKFNETISTLAHEFQHMINFGVKTMNGIPCDQNFNEMLSMLCEDMMQDFLALNDSSSPKARLRSFINSYYATGIRGYDSTLQSYANAYAFGAWLTRQYGGAALVKEMMQNGKANNDCIAAAVNSLNGSEFSFNEIFGQFVKSCFNDEESSANKAAEKALSYNAAEFYDYPMKEFNLWDIQRTKWYGSMEIAGTDSNGPAIFENSTVTDISASYGMFLKSWGEVAEDTESVTLNFTSESGKTNSGLLVYLYVK